MFPLSLPIFLLDYVQDTIIDFKSQIKIPLENMKNT